LSRGDVRIQMSSTLSSSGLTGRSSTPRPIDWNIGVSGILDQPLSRVMTGGYAPAFSRHRSPEFCKAIRPRKQRAQGKPGARCTRGLVCNVRKRKRTRAYRSSGGIPAFPARWVTAYFVLSPVNGSFATVAPRDDPGSLAPAPRRQDHTTSPSASGANVSCANRVHRISPRVRDVANAPLVDEMG
jgi:hypothetical protein